MSLMQCMLIGAVNEILNPTTRSEALESDHAEGWAKAMHEEYNSLLRNETWELVPRPKRSQGQRQNSILTSVWVLVTKSNEKGEVERLKARLAIREFMQKFVVRIESVRLVLLISMFLGLECKRVHLVTAFLNGELNNVVIYMEQPKGYEDGTDRVCRLRKNLYGLKQASKKSGKRVVFLTVYVDDILLAGISADTEQVIKQLALHFKLKPLGRIRHRLGMEINYLPGCKLCLSQKASIERLAEKYGLSIAKPVHSPQYHHEKTANIETNEKKAIVRSLQYLVACTRPDQANAVRTLVRYMSAYTAENYRAAQRVVRYALTIKEMGLVYIVSPEFPVLDTFCDADHQSCPETSRSVTGFLLRLHGKMWMWKSHPQRRVSEDICGSELVASCECTKMTVWARELMLELGFGDQLLHVLLNFDNQIPLRLVRHMAKHARFINEYVQGKELDVTYVPSIENIADVFTNALGPAEFERQRSKLNVEDVPGAWAVVATTPKGEMDKDIGMQEV
ncbi:Transposable element [Phytophthora megakarya]|uniref:Transposable element n=1 Tax=Phytophthora megakarya TaxID=4795 RepID=A0A225W580_9STRA|nr:Transposable element [Phytophthora megakarya]